MKVLSTYYSPKNFKQNNSVNKNTSSVVNRVNSQSQNYSKDNELSDLEIVSDLVGDMAEGFAKSIKKCFKKVDYYCDKKYNQLIEFLERKNNQLEKTNVKPKKKAQKTNITVEVPPYPAPDFLLDYDKILADLKSGKNLDGKWLEQNDNILKTQMNYNATETPDAKFFTVMSYDINRNKEQWIQAVEKYQTKEKAEYINRIRSEYIDIRPEQNKEKSIAGLKALQKYGTREDMLSLDKNFYDVSKDNEIMQEYAKLVGEVGETIDYTKLFAKLDEERYASYTKKTHEEIMKALKKLMVDKSEGYDFTHYNYCGYKDLEKFAENYENNSIIKEAAESIMKKIEEFNPSYKD